MRLTKKHIRQMILSEMKELDEAGVSREVSYVPPQKQQTSMRDQMVREIMAITVPGIPGAIYSQVEAEAMADAKIAALNAPMTGTGMSTDYGAPRIEVGMMSEMRMGHPADMPQGVTGYLEPEDPTDAPMPGMGMPAQRLYPHLDRMALEQELASHGLQSLPPEMPDEKLASLLQALGGPAEVLQEGRSILQEFDEFNTELEGGFEPGGYRAEADRRLSEVSIELDRWNLLAEATRK